MTHRRYEIGTATSDIFEADTIGNDPDLTTFDNLDVAIAEMELVIQMCGSETMTNGAIRDSVTGDIVWRQQ